MSSETTPRTDAEQFVAEQLALLLAPGSRYRVGALLLTYDCGDPNGCRIANGVGMQALTEAGAVDLVQMIKGLRHLADDIERKVQAAQSKGHV
jgi:hypothetical protein